MQEQLQAALSKLETVKNELREEQNALVAANADYEEMKAVHATEVAELKKRLGE